MNYLHLQNNPFAVLALLNYPNQNYALAQKISKSFVWPNTNFFYKNSTNILFSKQTTLNEVYENNFLMSLSPLAANGVTLGTFHRMLALYGYPHESMQMRCML
jgi:hypothetical protein